jgi:hypothetical protein
MGTKRLRCWSGEWAPVLGLVAFGSAVILLLGVFMPDWFARTSWERGNRNQSTAIFDSPAGYVGWMSLCGLVALAFLVVGLWRRRRAGAASLAVAIIAFSCAAYVGGSYWLDLTRGIALIEGRTPMGPTWRVDWPEALPLLVFAAIAGASSALILAANWVGRQGNGADAVKTGAG